MKKILFAMMAMCMFSLSASAKTDNNETSIKMNEKASNAEIIDCKNQGGLCYVIMTINGVTRTYRVCCGNVIVVAE